MIYSGNNGHKTIKEVHTQEFSIYYLGETPIAVYFQDRNTVFFYKNSPLDIEKILHDRNCRIEFCSLREMKRILSRLNNNSYHSFPQKDVKTLEDFGIEIKRREML